MTSSKAESDRGSGSPAESSSAHTVSYSRDNSTVNQTPSTSLLLDPGRDDLPDVPPPTYEEAIGISPSPTTAAAPPLPARQRHDATNTAVTGQHAPRLPPRTSPNPAAPRPAAATRPAAASVAGVYSNPKTSNSRRTASGSNSGGGGSSGSSSSSRNPASGSIPRGRQFPPTINLYGDNWARTFTLGEHQQTPLYAVRMRPAWQTSNPVIALHNGPNADAAPLLAAVDHVALSDHMRVTLPPPLTYTGSGSTAVALHVVLGWSHHYTFTMEVGTTLANVHTEAFEWRHSYGDAVAMLSSAREGWKLVRMSTQPLPGAPRVQPGPGFVSSDGCEVVAMFADARMSLSKHLKFAFVGTGLSGALGERWAVMAVTSALGIWEKEDAVHNRR